MQKKMNTLNVYKRNVVYRHQELATFAANKEKYVGKFYCKKPLKTYQTNLVYTGKYPKACPTGDSDKDNRHYLSLPGYDHPHVIMIDDCFYTLQIDMP